MEKLLYVLWKPEGATDEAFRDSLITGLAPRLRALGASRLKLCAVDDAVAAGKGLRIGNMRPPKAGMVSFWLEQSQERAEQERAIGDLVAKLAGYLVVE